MSSSLKGKYWVICTAMGAALFTLGSVMPVLAFPLMLVYSTSVLAISLDLGFFAGLASAFFTSGVIFFALGPVFALTYLLSYSLQGLILAPLSRKIPDGPELLAAGTVLSLICKVLTVVVFSRITGVNVVAQGTEEAARAMMAMVQARGANLSSAELLRMSEQIKEAIDYVVLFTPSIMILVSGMEILANCYAASYLHKKMSGDRFFTLPPLASWRFPRNILLALVVALICDFAGQRQPDAAIYRQIAANLGMMTRTLFVIQGLSLACYLMQRHGKPPSSRIIILVAAVAMLLTVVRDMLSILGLIDIGLDLRNRLGRNSK